MATNYQKADVQSFLLDINKANVAPALVTQILKVLGSTVHVQTIDDAASIVNPIGAEIKGSDVVVVNNGGSLDLSKVTSTNLSGVDAFVFTGDNNVNFTLDGTLRTDGTTHNTVAFKGVVNTLGGDDTIFTHSSQGVTVSAGEGKNIIDTGVDSATTGSGNDKIIVGNGDNEITTGAGNDTVIAGSGNDSITTGVGNDSVTSGAGDDSIVTGVGIDTVFAGAGNDSISSGAGNDSISTGIGLDTVDAGDGTDTIYVGAGEKYGEKVIAGGAGNDIIKLAAGYTGNAVIDGDGSINDKGELVSGTNLGATDKLDLSKVMIDNVEVYDSNGNIVTDDVTKVANVNADLHLKITLNDGSVLDVQHFEKFVYDTSTADIDGGALKLTGVDQFYAQFHHLVS